MKILKISNDSFGIYSRVKTLPQSTRIDMFNLMNMMRTRSHSNVSGDTFEKSVIYGLKSVDGVSLVNQGMVANDISSLPTFVEWDGVCLGIDVMEGEISEFSKPIFKSWKKILSKLDENVKNLIENFDNPEIVEQKTLTVNGYTPKAIAKITAPYYRDYYEKLGVKI